MDDPSHDRVRTQVRMAYAKIANGQDGCSVGCCGTQKGGASLLGYSEEELAMAPEGADLGLGCGNPQSIAALRDGETVLDLGSGGGFDCFLAAKRVGKKGRVIGVDLTPEMISKARENAHRAQASNVEFRLGEIEHLPAADASVDVVLSNCVINLSPDKAAVFRDAFRVLRPGGRLSISDVIATAAMPPALAQNLEALTGCVAGAVSAETLRRSMLEAGFEDIRIEPIPDSRATIGQCMPGAEDYVVSATIEARKPASACCGAACCADEGTFV